MAKAKRKIKRKVRVKQKVELVHKNDKTMVRRDTIDATQLRKAPTQMPRDNGLNMRVKIRRKTK